MKIAGWAGLMAAAALMAGCGNFWQAPGGSRNSFTLTNSGSVTVAQGATSSNVTITVTPGSSFTGTVALTCAVSTAPSGVTSSNYPTCTLSSSSLTFSTVTAQTPTMTATALSTTPLGAYDITVTGVSGSIAETTTVCVEVGTGTCTVAATASGKFYILNSPTSGSSTIVGESIASGAVTPISGSPWTVSGTPFLTASTMAIDPNDHFLCVSTTNGVWAYPITSGALGTAASASGDQDAAAIQVDQSGTWLVEAILVATGDVQLSAIPINSSTGANAASSSRAVGSTGFSAPNAAVHQLVISQDNKNVFVALGEGGTLVVPFNVNAPFPNGEAYTALIGVANTTTPGSALSVAVDPSATPRLFYIGETWAGSSGTTGGLRAFTYASLSTSPVSLVEAAGSPIASGGIAPNFVLPDASGDYVYVANGTGTSAGDAGVLGQFAVTGSAPNFTISSVGTAPTGVQPLGLAEDSTKSYVLEVGSDGSPYFDAFTFDSTTPGKLDSQIPSTTASNSIAIVAAPK
jgi:hypothetical protein